METESHTSDYEEKFYNNPDYQSVDDGESETVSVNNIQLITDNDNQEQSIEDQNPFEMIE